MPTYSLFGLVVDCDLELTNAVPADGTRPDLTVRGVPDGMVAADLPPGELLAELRDTDGVLAAATALDGAGPVVLRLRGVAEFTLDVAGATITHRRDPGVDPELIGVLVTGMCLATYLQLAGRHVLHASAVDVPELGGAVAFVGSSGMGKSTVATMLAGGDRRLFADDILRVDRAAGRLVAHRGTIETRLRPKAAGLGDGVAGSHATADGRVAVPVPASTASTLPLVAVVVPGPDPDADAVELTRLAGAGALFTLLAHPRLPGWLRQDEHTRHFEFLSDLVEQVPVFASRLPWGPPFAPDLGEHLVTELRAQI